MGVPSDEVLASFVGPVTEHTRRVDIYQADGITPWLKNAAVTDGSVSVDYSRDERRSIDITFDNSSGQVTYDPNGFWYDKIIKPFRGAYYDASVIVKKAVASNLSVDPRGTESGTGKAGAFGADRFTGNTSYTFGNSGGPAGTYAQGTVTTGRTLLGFHIAGNPEATPSVGIDVSEGVAVKVGLKITCSAESSWRLGIRFYDSSDTWLGSTVFGPYFDLEPDTWTEVSMTEVPPEGAVKMATYVICDSLDTGDTFGGTALLITANLSIPYFDGDLDTAEWTGTANDSTSILYETTLVTDRRIWETQIGEFMIDRIVEPHFPNIVKVSGRDYTKKMLLSKFTAATAFSAGIAIDVVINALAANSGISALKRVIPLTGKTLGRDFTFDSGVTRWEAAKEIADAYGYELFFDAFGNLIMREYIDPTLGSLSFTFSTGQVGTLVSYDKTVNDTRLYNHVLVTGEAADIAPVRAEARNDNPASPTNIALIGDRLYTYSSSFITTTQQAQDVANQFLAVHSLQEYEINLGSLILPWMEVGEVIAFEDPKATATQPDRFLLTNLTIPLALGAMDATGKRVTIVG